MNSTKEEKSKKAVKKKSHKTKPSESYNETHLIIAAAQECI